VAPRKIGPPNHCARDPFQELLWDVAFGHRNTSMSRTTALRPKWMERR
jgi:hypothetical protein